jgi:hypothetical protein
LYFIVALLNGAMNAQRAKRLEAMRANPRGDWRISDIEAVCRDWGLGCSAPRSGSHFKITHPDLPDMLSIPFARPIKPVYIRKLIAMVAALETPK